MQATLLKECGTAGLTTQQKERIMVEVRELRYGVEVVANGYREKFHSRFKAIMAAHALAYGESGANGGERIEIRVPKSWGGSYMVGGDDRPLDVF
jgi:hypothetical protein